MSNEINVNLIYQVFTNTVTSYKYFWFMSIIQLMNETNMKEFTFSDIITRMLANAWYPIVSHDISLGKKEAIRDFILKINDTINVDSDASIQTIHTSIKRNISPSLHKEIVQKLSSNVPYRFLSPWIKTSDDIELIERSIHYENNCLYAIHKERNNNRVILNDNWIPFLKDNKEELLAFIRKCLCDFVSKRNDKTVRIENLYKDSGCSACFAKEDIALYGKKNKSAPSADDTITEYIKQFPESTSFIQIVANCMNRYSAQYQELSFIDWSRMIQKIR